ncbi:hypothetical protein [Nocardia salmonicida]|nr:hypothetical protein [Nocardia salmonicida]
MKDAAREGLDAIGDGTSTAARLHEMQDFYGYMEQEMPALIERRRERVDS